MLKEPGPLFISDFRRPAPKIGHDVSDMIIVGECEQATPDRENEKPDHARVDVSGIVSADYHKRGAFARKKFRCCRFSISVVVSVV